MAQGEPGFVGRLLSQFLGACTRYRRPDDRLPSISTGVYGYPKDQAARIAVATLREYEAGLVEIICCCFSEAGSNAL